MLARQHHSARELSFSVTNESKFRSFKTKPSFNPSTNPPTLGSDLDLRTQLEQWVRTQLNERCSGDYHSDYVVTLMPLSGDAGFRQYYRSIAAESNPQAKKATGTGGANGPASNQSLCAASQSFLAVYAPPQTEDSQRFADLARLLRRNGVRAPQIIASDLEAGFLLLEDFGSVHLADRLQNDASLYYGEALLSLLRIQAIAIEAARELGIQDYSEAIAKREFDLCADWFASQWLGIDLSDTEHIVFHNAFSVLFEAFEAQPQVLVHRDFHSRNLMIAADESMGVIDFQDALIGPAAYDLISLTKDCYIKWPDDLVDSWNLGYAKLACASGLFPNELLFDSDADNEREKARRWLDQCNFVALQRHIKVLGIFARLAIRDGKTRYLNDLPRVFEYVMQALQRYHEREPALNSLYQFFASRLAPAFEKAMLAQQSKQT